MESIKPIQPGQCTCCGPAKDSTKEEIPEASRGEAKSFGDKANYWQLHNEITEKYDGDLMGRLNTGLDNLLIFVSLRYLWDAPR